MNPVWDCAGREKSERGGVRGGSSIWIGALFLGVSFAWAAAGRGAEAGPRSAPTNVRLESREERIIGRTLTVYESQMLKLARDNLDAALEQVRGIKVPNVKIDVTYKSTDRALKLGEHDVYARISEADEKLHLLLTLPWGSAKPGQNRIGLIRPGDIIIEARDNNGRAVKVEGPSFRFFGMEKRGTKFQSGSFIIDCKEEAALSSLRIVLGEKSGVVPLSNSK